MTHAFILHHPGTAPTTGAITQITNKDIVQGSLAINNYSCNGDFLEVGTAISEEMSMSLENTDGRWDSYDFVGDYFEVYAYEPVPGNLISSGFPELVQSTGTITFYSNYAEVTGDYVNLSNWSEFEWASMGVSSDPDIGELDSDSWYMAECGLSPFFKVRIEGTELPLEQYALDGQACLFRPYQSTGVTMYLIPKVSRLVAGIYEYNITLQEVNLLREKSYFLGDEAMYSKGRVNIKALDGMSVLDAYPAVLNNYNEPGFKVYSDGTNVRSKPIGTSAYIIGSTIRGQNYTIAEIQDNEYGRWFRLTSTDIIYKDSTGANAAAGDSAWVSTMNTTGTIYPYDHAATYLDLGITTGQTTLKKLFQAEIAVNDSYATNFQLFDFDTDVWEELDTIELNMYVLGNQFTLRQLVAWGAGLLGKCAYVNGTSVRTGEGVFGSRCPKIGFKWYETTSATYTDATAYLMELQKKAISVTGLSAEIKGTPYVYGTDEYMISIGSNPLMDAFHQVTLDGTDYGVSAWLEQLYNRLSGISYVPFNATVVETPTCLVLDNITYGDLTLPVTDWTWTLNGATQLRGRGSTTVNKGYASSSGGTSSSIPYAALTGKPTINGVQLVPGLTGESIGLLPTAGGTMTGNITLESSSVHVEQTLRDTSNYGAAVQWDTATGYASAYKPQIGFHNTGTSMCLLPYETSSAPYDGNVGLFIKHATNPYMKLEGNYMGRFTTTPTSGQVVVTDGTVGGMKSSGYTIATSVPSGAKFTDTTYSGTGLISVSSSNVISTTATKNTMGGTYRTSVWAASASVANNTWTRKGTITLAAGYYVLTFTVNWASATAGNLYRSSLSTTSADEEPARSMAMATTGQICRYEHTVVLHPTASTTYYYNVFQNSGADVNCSVYFEFLSIT